MNTIIPTIGTRGDVQPYIVLALGLLRAGHTEPTWDAPQQPMWWTEVRHSGPIQRKEHPCPASLRFVAAPLLHFEPPVAGELDGDWVVGKTYTLRLYLFGFLPAEEHRITLASIDRDANLIESKESGALSPVWNHTIRFHSLGDGKLHYTDEIEIQAGLLTGIIWAFAHLFYRHRQRRWKTLLRSKTQDLK